MSEAKHTPGPWQAIDDWGRIVGTRQPSSVCHCGDWTVATMEPSYEFHGSDEADARLIAAAPELLEVLQRMVRDLETDGVAAMQATLNTHGRAAVTKATGAAA